MTLIHMFDRVGGDAALAVKGEDEEAAEVVALVEAEDRLLGGGGEEGAEAVVETCGFGGVGGR